MNVEQTFPAASETSVEYRSVSVAAVVAAALGISSATALAHPLMWWLPLVTILVAVAALRRISKSNGALTGTPLAVLAICLAVFFLSWAVTRLVVGRSIEADFASQAATSWFELIRRGDLYEAHQWTISGYNRQPEGTVLADYYRDDAEARRDFERFRDETLSQAMPHLSADDRIEFQRVLDYQGRRNHRLLRLLFHRYVPGATTPAPVTVHIERRYFADYDMIYWRIKGVDGDH